MITLPFDDALDGIEIAARPLGAFGQKRGFLCQRRGVPRFTPKAIGMVRKQCDQHGQAFYGLDVTRVALERLHVIDKRLVFEAA